MFLVVGDDNSRVKTKPFVVAVLLAMNVLVFIGQQLNDERAVFGWGAVPYEITHNVDLVGEKTIQAHGSFSTAALGGSTGGALRVIRAGKVCARPELIRAGVFWSHTLLTFHLFFSLAPGG